MVASALFEAALQPHPDRVGAPFVRELGERRARFHFDLVFLPLQHRPYKWSMHF